jgi:tRNA (adenine37-N6)-methyltransferase
MTTSARDSSLDPMHVLPIGRVESDYTDPSATPSQAAENAGAGGRVVVHEEFVDALLGLDGYPYVWLLTWLHQRAPHEDVPLQLVPRAMEGTGRVQGVFASRSPRRPNPIGLSLVRNLGVAGNVVTFGGVDLLDGTPVLDLKPWFADCDAPSGPSS